MVGHNQTVDLQDCPLLKAARLCPAHIRTETGVGVADALECLEYDDWEAALLLLEELGDAHPQPPGFWDLLADAAVRAERRRIARELHDVVAHHITTMNVLIGAARTIMTSNPGQAQETPRRCFRTFRSRPGQSSGVDLPSPRSSTTSRFCRSSMGPSASSTIGMSGSAGAGPPGLARKAPPLQEPAPRAGNPLTDAPAEAARQRDDAFAQVDRQQPQVEVLADRREHNGASGYTCS